MSPGYFFSSQLSLIVLSIVLLVIPTITNRLTYQNIPSYHTGYSHHPSYYTSSPVITHPSNCNKSSRLLLNLPAITQYLPAIVPPIIWSLLCIYYHPSYSITQYPQLLFSIPLITLSLLLHIIPAITHPVSYYQYLPAIFQHPSLLFIPAIMYHPSFSSSSQLSFRLLVITH